MVDLVITATAVVAGSTATTGQAVLGAAGAAGQVAYIDTDGTLKLAINNSGTPIVRQPGSSGGGILLNGGAAGQPAKFLKDGPLTVNAVLTPGVMYYLSTTPGGICPVADLGAGKYPVALGFATSTSQIMVKITEAGVSL